MVEEGVAAARQGERGQARALLLQATALAPDAFDAWLWLGGLADDPRHAVQYLERAVALQPDNVRARRGLEWAQQRLNELGGPPPPEAAKGEAPLAPSAPEALSGEEVPDYGTSEFDRLVASLSQPPAGLEGPVTTSPAATPPPVPALVTEPPADLAALGQALAGLLSSPPVSESPEQRARPEQTAPEPEYQARDAPGEAGAAVPLAAVAEEPPAPEQPPEPEEPLDADLALAAARQSLAEGDPAAAARTLGRLVRQQPDVEEARQMLGVALFRAGDFGQAAALYEAAVEEDNENVVALTNLGLLYNGMGRPEEAVPLLQRAVRADHQSLEAWVTLAEALREAGRPVEALAHFEEALRRRPDLTELAEGLAATQAALGQLGKAVGRYRALMRSHPGDPGLPLRFAHLLARAGRRREALEACRAAVKIDPRCAEAHHLASRLLLEMKKRREALAAARAVLVIDPEHAGAAEIVRQLTAPPARKRGLFARLFHRPTRGDVLHK